LVLEYDGRAFHGWQRQRDLPSVQATLEDALSGIADHPVILHCAGRTDAGVHANAQVAHFDTDAQRPMTAWVRGVNALLPETVAIRAAIAVPETFHARYSACRRRYRYLLLNRPQRPGLWSGRAGWLHAPLDLAAMREAAACLVGEHDFSAFRAAGCQAKTPVRLMTEVAVCQSGAWFMFDFEANGFLHHMVRNLVGSLVCVGKGAWSPAHFRAVFAGCRRCRAAPTFAPHGLYFRGARYDPVFGIPEMPESPDFPFA
jgi:tRNA pseudouridine38-40 synthase